MTPSGCCGSAEQFYVSLGFPAAARVVLAGLGSAAGAAGGPRKKNAHASAWHIDGEQDVRSLMSVEPNDRWFGTAHHELGHIYYYLAYARPEVPYLLRAGANRAFHEAIGELARLASQQPPYLRRIGLVRAGQEPDPAGWLLSSAMDSIVFLAFAAGTMSHFEHDLYESELPAGRMAGALVAIRRALPGRRSARPPPGRAVRRLYQDPPQRRSRPVLRLRAGHADQVPAARPHLPQDPQAGRAGLRLRRQRRRWATFLRGILSLGATRDWRTVMQEATGETIGPRAMLDFFRPLQAELDRRNAGKDCRRE